MSVHKITRPRCFLVYALAPPTIKPNEANRQFNEFVADRRLPRVIFHDHFIGQAGGVAIFYAETAAERAALQDSGHLAGWQVEIRPLIFSHSPAAFDAQTAFTLRAYRGLDWETLRHEQRPYYGNLAQEAETAVEDSSS